MNNTDLILIFIGVLLGQSVGVLLAHYVIDIYENYEQKKRRRTRNDRNLA